MSLGEIWWIFDDLGRNSLKLALTALTENGLLAENSLGERWYLNEEGERSAWNESLIFERWNSGEPVAMQFWLSSDTDVMVVAVRNSGLVTLDLDGHSLAEARRTSQIALGAALAVNDTRGMVIDHRLDDYGDEFIGLVSTGRMPTNFEPALFMFRSPGQRSFNVTIGQESWLTVKAGVPGQ
ncbi:hypothetical protein [Actinoplanes awajinensis]|uniref:hypothetical protein n=1 Tax=Actinoplanes awajinensis TaxID=135946 RepID=UPI0012FB4D2C|nr:hypothetical protein [Actinoplanes awajinensis]